MGPIMRTVIARVRVCCTPRRALTSAARAHRLFNSVIQQAFFGIAPADGVHRQQFSEGVPPQWDGWVQELTAVWERAGITSTQVTEMQRYPGYMPEDVQTRLIYLNRVADYRLADGTELSTRHVWEPLCAWGGEHAAELRMNGERASQRRRLQ